MQTSGYFLGIDGGGTRTVALCCDAQGTVVAKVSGDSINFYSEGMQRARENMRDVVNQIEALVGVSEFEGVFIGSSALSGEADTQTLETFTKDIFNAKNIVMDSDLAAALMTMYDSKECVAVISGTGSMAVLKTAHNEVKTAGGWGYILGDEGSAYAIAIDGIRAGIRGFEGSAEKTVLTDELVSFFNASDIYDLIGLFYDPPMERKKIADFARCVCSVAERDAVAKDIVKSQAESLSKTVLALIKDQPKDIKIGLWGGVALNSKLFRDALTQSLASQGYENVCVLPFSPEVGAVFGAVIASGNEVTESFKSKISNDGGNK